MNAGEFVRLILTNPDKLDRELNKMDKDERVKLLRAMEKIIDDNVRMAESGVTSTF
jgi:hypothetical protein